MLRLFRNNDRFIFVSCRNWQRAKKWKIFTWLVPPPILYRKMPRLCVKLEIDLLFIRSSLRSVPAVKTSLGRYKGVSHVSTATATRTSKKQWVK